MSDIEFPTPPVRMSQFNAALIDHLPKQDNIGPLNVPSNLQAEQNDHKSIWSQEYSPSIATLNFSLLAVGSCHTPRFKKLFLLYRDVLYSKPQYWPVLQKVYLGLLNE